MSTTVYTNKRNQSINNIPLSEKTEKIGKRNQSRFGETCSRVEHWNDTEVKGKTGGQELDLLDWCYLGHVVVWRHQTSTSAKMKRLFYPQPFRGPEVLVSPLQLAYFIAKCPSLFVKKELQPRLRQQHSVYQIKVDVEVDETKWSTSSRYANEFLFDCLIKNCWLNPFEFNHFTVGLITFYGSVSESMAISSGWRFWS